MGIYDYLNANNNQIADLSYNAQAKALIDSLMGGTKLTTDTNQMMYQPDETGNRSDIPRTDQNGNILYIDNVTGEATTSPYAHTYLNGQEASKVGENKYSIGVDDPTSRGLFDVNVQVDPNTGKVSNLGTTYRSHGNNTQWYAPLAMAAMVAAPYLAPEIMGTMGGAEAGTIAGDAFLPGALASEYAPEIAAEVASQTAPAVTSAVAPEVASSVVPEISAPLSTTSEVLPEVAPSPLSSLPSEVVPPEVAPSPTETPTFDVSPQAPIQNVSPELDPTSQMAQNATSPLQQIKDAYSALPSPVQSALKGAGQGMVTNAGVDLITGKPVTGSGLATAALVGGASGGIGDLVGGATEVPALGKVAGTLAGIGTGALLGGMGTTAPSSTTPTTTSGLSTTPTTSLDMAKTSPKATTLKGTQIASPLASSYNIPIENYAPTSVNPLSLQEIQNAADGGIIHMADGGDLPMTPKQLRGQATQHASLFGGRGVPLTSAPHFANGGNMMYQDRTLPNGHNPKFFSEGGLNSMENRYVTGDGDGTSDSIPAMLANGEFVIPADIVSGLGNGSNDAGANILNAFMETIREHKQNHDAKHLPEDSKGPLAYLLQAKQKVKA